MPDFNNSLKLSSDLFSGEDKCLQSFGACRKGSCLFLSCKEQTIKDGGWSKSDNRELAKRMRGLPAKIMVCHYPNAIDIIIYRNTVQGGRI